MNEERIKEVFSDEAFVKELLELESIEEVQAALKEKGIDASDDEIIKLRDEFIGAAEIISEKGELSLDELDEASGGSLVVGSLVFLASAGSATVGGVGMVAGAVTIGTGFVLAAGGAMVGAMAAGTAATLGIAAGIGAIGSALKNRRW